MRISWHGGFCYLKGCWLPFRESRFGLEKKNWKGIAFGRPALQRLVTVGSDSSKSTMKTNAIGSLGGGFKHFLFSSLFGEDSHFD